jgi:hypothetical protein
MNRLALFSLATLLKRNRPLFFLCQQTFDDAAFSCARFRLKQPLKVRDIHLCDLFGHPLWSANSNAGLILPESLFGASEPPLPAAECVEIS